jgi:branched-chain amino acid transport system ATP-binding protein
MSEAATAPPATSETTALLEIEGLNAFYGKAQALDDVNMRMQPGSLAIVGRNGMGKTTLCNAIMGITPPTATGSIRFEGQELVGGHSYRIARRGIGYVPQGRRLFPSLSVDEHLKIASRGAGGGAGSDWTRERVYELFPRLAERKRNGGAQLSGGEQQMLAIGRALVTNPRLLVMDEPSEGLAPVIVEQMAAAVGRMKAEGIAVLLSEQNLYFAGAVADRAYIIEKGAIRHEGRMADIAADAALREAYLSV